MERSFQRAYLELEERMKALAETDGDVFLPNPQPSGTAQYVLICMEPSLGRWARSAVEARSKVEKGFRNFLYSIEDFILHFCVRRYLCGSEQRYHITDLSKGAMLVNRANSDRMQRYDRWYALLEEELDLCAAPGAGIVAVGKAVSQHLERRGFRRSFTRVIHYSTQAVPARAAGIVGLEDRFRAFADSVSMEDVLVTAGETFRAANLPSGFRDDTLSRIAKSQLTNSRKQLMFNYKIAFESIPRRKRPALSAWPLENDL
jgi:hypothetical protein